jgi:rod shape-determining protein MreD
MYELYSSSPLRFVAALMPFVLGVFATAVANFPVSFTNGLFPTPLFGLMAVYFWGLMRPDLMPPLAAFLIGLCEDVLSGGPPGIWAAAFMVCYIFVERQRESLAGLASYGAILGFAAAMIVTAASAFVIVAVYYWRLPPVAPVVVAVAANVLWYIPALAIMSATQHRLIGPARGDF